MGLIFLIIFLIFIMCISICLYVVDKGTEKGEAGIVLVVLLISIDG